MAEHIIFGTGAIGRAVMEELCKRGEQVRMVNRSGQMPETPAQIEVVKGDVTDPQDVRRLAQGAKVVYQCTQPPYNRWPELFPPMQAAILAGLHGSNTRLVIADNLYMYGETNGEAVTEDTPYRANTRKGQTRAEMAESALQAHQSGSLWVASGRGADYFGPWGLPSTMGERAIYPALAGKTASLVGNIDLPHTYTFLGDFGRALVILGEHDEAGGQAWHVPNDRPTISQREFAELIFKEIGLPPKVSGMGKTMMRIGGLFIPEARESIEMMYQFEQPFIVDSSKFTRAFGVKATPLEESIPATVAWYRTHPKR